MNRSESLPEDVKEFIARRNTLQAEYVESYLDPHPNPERESESDFRERVREVILQDLPREDRIELRTETAKLRRDLLGSYDSLYHS